MNARYSIAGEGSRILFRQNQPPKWWPNRYALLIGRMVFYFEWGWVLRPVKKAVEVQAKYSSWLEPGREGRSLTGESFPPLIMGAGDRVAMGCYFSDRV